MIDSLQNVSENMFKVFAGDNLDSPLSVPTYEGGFFTADVAYARQGSDGYAETSLERYPIVSIQEYAPEFLDEWHNDAGNVAKRYSLLKDTDNDGSFDTVSWVKDPFFMQFRFDVSTATKNFIQHKDFSEYFIRTFGKAGTFPFNYEPISNQADYVEYRVQGTNIERTDGVFETNYEFNLKCFVYITNLEEYSDIIEKLNITLKNKTYK
jgi:hypothetical protein